MARAHRVPLLRAVRLGPEGAHDRAGLRGEIAGRADQHHRGDQVRLLGRDVQQRVAAQAEADGLAPPDAQVLAQRAHVARALPVRERARRVRRPAVPARVRDDEAVTARERVEVVEVDPVRAGAREAVQQQQGFARAVDLVVDVGAFD